MGKVFYTPVEFSKYTKIGICSVRDMCNIDGFPAAKNGRNYLIHCDQAIDWIMTIRRNDHTSKYVTDVNAIFVRN